MRGGCQCCSSVLCVYFCVVFVFTLYLEPTIASVPCFVCLHFILSLLLPVSLDLFVFTLYLEPTIASVPCFVCLHTVS